MNNLQFTMISGKTNYVGTDAHIGPIAECSGAITVVHRSIATISMNQVVRYAEITDFRFVFDKYGPMWASVPTLGSNILTNSDKKTIRTSLRASFIVMHYSFTNLTFTSSNPWSVSAESALSEIFSSMIFTISAIL